MVQNLHQFFRFILVGLLAVGMDFVVYFGLLQVAPFIPLPISKAMSFICGAIVSFTGHRSFVFKAHDRHPRYQILPFAILYGSSLIANNLVNSAVLNLTGIKIVAWFIAICTSTTMNFLGMKFKVFKKSLPLFTSSKTVL